MYLIYVGIYAKIGIIGVWLIGLIRLSLTPKSFQSIQDYKSLLHLAFIFRGWKPLPQSCYTDVGAASSRDFILIGYVRFKQQLLCDLFLIQSTINLLTQST